MSYRCSRVCFVFLFFLVICIPTDFSTLEQKQILLSHLTLIEFLDSKQRGLYLCICDESVALWRQVGARESDLHQTHWLGGHWENLKVWAGNDRLTSFSKRGGSFPWPCWLEHTCMYYGRDQKKKSLTSFRKVGIQIVMWRTYLARVVRMLYVRVSTLRTATIVLPCGSDVWTSSCNPVRSLPSCSITVFSTLSCWPAVWVASPTRQEDGIKEVAVLWVTDCEEASYSNLIYWLLLGFSFWR